MTSDDTHGHTLRLLEDNSYFGLRREQVRSSSCFFVVCVCQWHPRDLGAASDVFLLGFSEVPTVELVFTNCSCLPAHCTGGGSAGTSKVRSVSLAGVLDQAGESGLPG